MRTMISVKNRAATTILLNKIKYTVTLIIVSVKKEW